MSSSEAKSERPVREFTPAASDNSVTLVVSGADGGVYYVASGHCPAAAEFLRTVPEGYGGIQKVDTPAVLPGQDSFSVPRETLLSLIGILTFMPDDERTKAANLFPDGCCFHLVVSY